jgi:hypothetical protein
MAAMVDEVPLCDRPLEHRDIERVTSELQDIYHLRCVFQKELDDLVPKIHSLKHPPSIYLEEYSELMEKISELSAKEKLLLKVLENCQAVISREITPENEPAPAAVHQPNEHVAKATVIKRTKSACSQQSCSESSGGVQSPTTSPPAPAPPVKQLPKQQGRESPMRSHVRAYLPHQQRTMVRKHRYDVRLAVYFIPLQPDICCRS